MRSQRTNGCHLGTWRKPVTPAPCCFVQEAPGSAFCPTGRMRAVKGGGSFSPATCYSSASHGSGVHVAAVLPMLPIIWLKGVSVKDAACATPKAGGKGIVLDSAQLQLRAGRRFGFVTCALERRRALVQIRFAVGALGFKAACAVVIVIREACREQLDVS